MQNSYPMALGIFLGLLISSGIAAVVMRNDMSEAQAVGKSNLQSVTVSFEGEKIKR
jgi:hypothetical protein